MHFPALGHSEVFISHNRKSKDIEDCGASGSPCRSIDYAISKLNTNQGVVLNIDGGLNKESPYIYKVTPNTLLNYSDIVLRQWQHGNLSSPKPIIMPNLADLTYKTDFIFKNIGNVTVNSISFIRNTTNTFLWFIVTKSCRKCHLYRAIFSAFEGSENMTHKVHDDLSFYTRSLAIDIRLYNSKIKLNFFSGFLLFPSVFEINSMTSFMEIEFSAYHLAILNGRVFKSKLQLHQHISIVKSRFEESLIETSFNIIANQSHFKNGRMNSRLVYTVLYSQHINVQNCIFENYSLSIDLNALPNSVYFYKTKFINLDPNTKESSLFISRFDNQNVSIVQCLFSNAMISNKSYLWVKTKQRKNCCRKSKSIKKPLLLIDTVFNVSDTDRTVFRVSKRSVLPQFYSTSLICGYGRYMNYFITKEKDEEYLSTNCLNCGKGTYIFGEKREVKISSFGFTNNSQTCILCPYNSVCAKGHIQLKSGYWGYPRNRTLKMIPCPAYYCCSSKIYCKSFNSCHKHRTGRLCSDCQPGFSSDISVKHLCIENSKCNNSILSFVVATIAALVLVFVLMYWKEIILFWKRKLNRINHYNRSTDSNQDANEVENLRERFLHESFFPGDPQAPLPFQILESSENVDTNHYPKTTHLMSGSLKILLFFYQAAALIRIPSADKQDLLLPKFLDIIFTLFNIKLDISYSKIILCILPNMSVIEAKLAELGFIFITFGIIVGLFVGSYIANIVTRKNEVNNQSDEKYFHRINEEVPAYSYSPFPVRVTCIYVQFLLVAFSSIATFSFLTISCVAINDKTFLYIQASVECYQPWQYAMLVFVVIWVIPFPFSLYIGPKLLTKCCIKPAHLLLLLSFPPAILALVLKKKFQLQPQKLTIGEAMHAKHLLLVINEPFRNSKADNGSKLCWEAVLILRRMLLVLSKTFILSPITKLYPMAALLLLFVFHHIIMKPFADKILNKLEIASQLCLLSLVVVNMFWANTREYGLMENPTYRRLGKFLMCYEVMIFSLPFVVLILYLVYQVLKKSFYFFKHIFHKEEVSQNVLMAEDDYIQ